MSTPLARLEHISLSLGGRRVLRDVSLALRKARITTLIGPNGAGKTTLAHVLLRLVRPDAGAVYTAPGLRIGFVPQRLHVDPVLPVRVCDFLALVRRASPRAVALALEEAGLSALGTTPLHALSAGEMQRVLLVRALMRQPDLLVLDEPAAALDPVGQSAFYAFLARLPRETSCGILIISHDLHIVMREADDVICLNTHVCCRGTPDAVSRHPEYRALFPDDALGVYRHRHDHTHGSWPESPAPHG